MYIWHSFQQTGRALSQHFKQSTVISWVNNLVNIVVNAQVNSACDRLGESLWTTCALGGGVSCGQYAGKTCGRVAVPIFGQAHISYWNQPFVHNGSYISTGLRTNFVCNFCLIFTHGVDYQERIDVKKPAPGGLRWSCWITYAFGLSQTYNGISRIFSVSTKRI